MSGSTPDAAELVIAAAASIAALIVRLPARALGVTNDGFWVINRRGPQP